MQIFVKEQNKTLEEATHLTTRQGNIKGRGSKIWHTTEFYDLAQSYQVHSSATLDSVTSFKGNHYIRG
jgi:hypothetical protein